MRRYQSNFNESSSADPLTDSLSEQNALSTDYCEEEQPDLVDSKENLRTLYADQKFNINYVCEADIGQQSIGAVCDHNKQLNDLDIKITQCIDQNNETNLKLDGFKKALDMLLHKIGMEEGPPFDNIEANEASVEDDFKTSSSGVSLKFNVVDSKITKCVLSNKLTHLKLDNLQKSLDLILKNIDNVLIDSEASAEPLLDNEEGLVFRFPISSVNELNKLDEELQHNETLMSNLIAKFTKIAGDSGNKSAKKVGVKIIERIISAKLLTKFTWTGRTNGANNIKLPFITYSSIFYLCLQVISKADRSFDKNACENFLKNNILKHSSMRLSRKFNKKIKRSKSNDETWCTRTKVVINKSTMQSQSKRRSIHSNVSEEKSETEECAFVDEVVDSKANIINLLDVQKETNNNPEVEEESNNYFSPKSFLKICDHESKLDMMDRKISNCIESNTKVHSKIDTMQETLNIILNTIGKCQGFSEDPHPARVSDLASETIDDEFDSFYYPITSVSDLQELNRKLSTIEHFEEKMITKFFSIVGNGKNMSTQRFGLEVVESVISPQLLMKYSWTGRSKSIKPKLAFMKYKYIVNFFQNIISKVDKHFNQKECEDFLRFTVFKYINMRVARRRKIKDQRSEYFADKQDFNTTSLSIQDFPIEGHEKGNSYEYKCNSTALEFPEANVQL